MSRAFETSSLKSAIEKGVEWGGALGGAVMVVGGENSRARNMAGGFQPNS